jgi:anti-sigma factor RsiW
MNQQTVERTDNQLLSAYINGKLSRAEKDALVERLGREPHLAGRLEFMRASDIAEEAVLSTIYEKPRLPSVIRLIETTQPESLPEKIAALTAPYFQRTVGIAAGVTFVLGFLLGGLFI